MDTAELSTALTIPAATDLVALFKTEDGLDPLIARIEAEVRSHVPDLTTKKGRDAIASLAYKVARSKTALDDAGKMLTDEQRKAISVVDAARRKVRERLDALRDEARKPLDDWEAAEQERVQRLKQRIKNLNDAMPPEETEEAFADLIRRVEAVNPDDGSWGEFALDATHTKTSTLKRLRDAAELFRLRREAAAREDADRIAAAKAAAEEVERLEREAEAERQRQAEAAEAERVRQEDERRAQIEKDRQEAAAQAAREAEQRAAEQAERDRQAAAAREEALRKEAEEREAALQRELDAQKAETERAAQAERDRLAEQQRAAQEAEERRAADVAHRARIRKEIIAAIETCGGAGIVASLIADAILEGKVPHVKAVL